MTEMIAPIPDPGFTAPNEFQRVFNEERTIIEITEGICDLMEKQNVSHRLLAQRMGKSESQVSQMLNGDSNLTVRSISHLLLAMGLSLEMMTRSSDDDAYMWYNGFTE